MRDIDFKTYFLNKLLIVALIWVSLSVLFQITIIGLDFLNNEKAIKKITNWYNYTFDGRYKN